MQRSFLIIPSVPKPKAPQKIIRFASISELLPQILRHAFELFGCMMIMLTPENSEEKISAKISGSSYFS
jgi:hypothetical protein